MKKIVTVLLFILISSSSLAQDINIGDDAEYAKTVIEWSVSRQNKSNPLKNPSKPYWTSNCIYKNGTLTEVNINKQKEMIYGLSNNVNYHESLVIKNNKVDYIIKSFDNVELEVLKVYYNNNFTSRSIDNLYFTPDFEYYYKFYPNKNNLASVECHKKSNSKFDKNILQKIENLKKKQQNEAIKSLLDDGREAEIKEMKKETVENEKEIKRINTDSIDNIFKSRKITLKATPKGYNEEGVVVLKVIVNRSGKVIQAIAINGTIGSTCLINASKVAALRTKFEPKDDAPETQAGTITYNFKITD